MVAAFTAVDFRAILRPRFMADLARPLLPDLRVVLAQALLARLFLDTAVLPA